MKRELSDDDRKHQAEAFLDLCARRRWVSFSRWAESKDFTPADRKAIESLVRQARQRGAA